MLCVCYDESGRPLYEGDVVTVSVLPAVAEEALFRGALLPALGGGPAGVVGAGVVFGALHAGRGPAVSGPSVCTTHLKPIILLLCFKPFSPTFFFFFFFSFFCIKKRARLTHQLSLVKSSEAKRKLKNTRRFY